MARCIFTAKSRLSQALDPPVPSVCPHSGQTLTSQILRALKVLLGGATVLESRTSVLHINLIIFWDDVFSGAQHRIASGLFKDVDSGASVSRPDFLP